MRELEECDASCLCCSCLGHHSWRSKGFPRDPKDVLVRWGVELSLRGSWIPLRYILPAQGYRSRRSSSAGNVILESLALLTTGRLMSLCIDRRVPISVVVVMA